MPRSGFSGSFGSPRIDVAIDMGNPFLNLSVDGFLKIGAVAAEETYHAVKKGLAISERSNRAGLEQTRLLGRSQILTPREAEAVGLCGISILIDGGRKPEIVLLSETTVAGGKSRTTSVSVLKDAWNKAAVDLGVNVLDIGIIDSDTTLEDHLSSLQGLTDTKRIILAGCLSESTGGLLKVADLLLRSQTGAKSGLITVTGSLHIVGSVFKAY